MSEIKILGFVCQWCAYQGADLAGVSRLNYPAEVRLIKVPCSGRVSSHMVFKAFQEGAEGVFLAGCHPGDCHYQSGNIMAENRVKVIQEMLESIGIDSERLKFFHISASEAKRFQKTISDFYGEIKNRGFLSLKNGR